MNPYDFAEKKSLSARRLVDFTLCSNPLGPSSKARSAMRKVVREVGVFPDDRARYLRRFLGRKEGIPEESLLFGHGSGHILSLYLQVFKPTAVSLPYPCSLHRALLLEQQRVACERLSLVPGEDGFVMDAEQLLSHAQSGRTLLLSNPHDPTGATVPAGLIDRLIETVEHSGGMLIIDEALIEFTGLESAARRAAGSLHCLVLRSLSLFHALAGLRIGYGIGHPLVVDRLKSGCAPGSVSTMALASARASLADKGYYKRTSEYVNDEKNYIRNKLSRVAGLIIRDTPCNFILVGLDKPVPDIADLLLDRSILVDTFQDPKEERLWIRLPVRRRPQNARFAKTLRYLLSMPETG